MKVIKHIRKKEDIAIHCICPKCKKPFGIDRPRIEDKLARGLIPANTVGKIYNSTGFSTTCCGLTIEYWVYPDKNLRTVKEEKEDDPRITFHRVPRRFRHEKTLKGTAENFSNSD